MRGHGSITGSVRYLYRSSCADDIVSMSSMLMREEIWTADLEEDPGATLPPPLPGGAQDVVSVSGSSYVCRSGKDLRSGPALGSCPMALWRETLGICSQGYPPRHSGRPADKVTLQYWGRDETVAAS